MDVSATYLCPVRGLAHLEAPDPHRLGQAAALAKTLGMARLELPVLEEAITGGVREKIRFLDGLVRALDRSAERGMMVRMIAPARRILGLSWALAEMLRPSGSDRDPPIFAAGEIRALRPLDWWGNPMLMEKRIRAFRELIGAVKGHPAIAGWVVLDRALDWPRPDPKGAEYFLRCLTAEIRQRDEECPVLVGVGWGELLDPVLVRTLVREVQGLRIGGLEEPPSGLEKPAGLPGDLLMAAYLGSLAQWLFGRPAEVEVGWGLTGEPEERDSIQASGGRLSRQGLKGVVWANLVDPEPPLLREPPWLLKAGAERLGLLRQDLEPKEWVERLFRELLSGRGDVKGNGFIDLGPEEFMADPRTHLTRLWDHFLRGT